MADFTVAIEATGPDGANKETEFSFKMHKKPEIAFNLPEEVEAGIQFELKIDFDGAKLERAEIFLMKVPSGGYKDPETGIVITENDAKRQIE
jgi:hypothetical protein